MTKYIYVGRTPTIVRLEKEKAKVPVKPGTEVESELSLPKNLFKSPEEVKALADAKKNSKTTPPANTEKTIQDKTKAEILEDIKAFEMLSEEDLVSVGKLNKTDLIAKYEEVKALKEAGTDDDNNTNE